MMLPTQVGGGEGVLDPERVVGPDEQPFARDLDVRLDDVRIVILPRADGGLLALRERHAAEADAPAAAAAAHADLAVRGVVVLVVPGGVVGRHAR